MPVEIHSDILGLNGFSELNQEDRVAAIRGFTNQLVESEDFINQPDEIVDGLFQEEAKATARSFGVSDGLVEEYFHGDQFAFDAAATDLDKTIMSAIKEDTEVRRGQIGYSPLFQTPGKQLTEKEIPGLMEELEGGPLSEGGAAFKVF